MQAVSILTKALGFLFALAVLATAVAPAANAKAGGQDFQLFIAGLWPEAQQRGVSRATFDAAFEGIAFDARVVARTNAQAEFVKPIWEYLSGAVSSERVARGQSKAEAQASWLNKAKRAYGVDPAIVMGVWGLETDFGGFAGSDNVIRSLASLAFIHYRGEFFKGELLAALTILQHGDIGPREMKGSWAGAMGQTQFMPSSFLDFAVDFDGDGRRDIWGSPADAIGSTANYLKEHGWIAGEPWGMEVRLPAGFALTDADSSQLAPFSAFAARGVRRADGDALPRSGAAQLLIPAGLNGPIFLITANFKVIKSYNSSTAYALGVALLGDRIEGGAGIAAHWPHDKTLSLSQMRDFQARLQKKGYDVGKIDGMVGESVRAAVRAWQQSLGLAPDGYPTPALYRRLAGKG